jgi:hypothetical protein
MVVGMPVIQASGDDSLIQPGNIGHSLRLAADRVAISGHHYMVIINRYVYLFDSTDTEAVSAGSRHDACRSHLIQYGQSVAV